jgi:hypothetical protein
VLRTLRVVSPLSARVLRLFAGVLRMTDNEDVFCIAELKIMRDAFDKVVEQGCCTSRDEAARAVIRMAREHGCSSVAALVAMVQLTPPSSKPMGMA